MEADIQPEDINRLEAFTRRNLLSLTCQFFYCMGLGTPLVMGLRILYSQVCNKGGVGMQDVLDPDIQIKIRESLIELLQGPLLRFQRRIVFKQQGTLVIFWDGSLTAFGACAYIVSGGGVIYSHLQERS